MLSINRVMITGRLTRDPETRYLPTGQAVTKMGVAVNRRFQDKNGEWRDETAFIDVEAWGKVAERCAETLKKGRPVYVEGRLKQESWEKDGVKQSKLMISAERVTAFDVPQRGDSGGGEEDLSEGPSAVSRPQARSAARPQTTGAPSDNLDFSNPNANTEDDIPF